MTFIATLQIVTFFTVLILLVKPLGSYMARVYHDEPLFGIDRMLGPVERQIYRACGVRQADEMAWPAYAIGVLLFNLFGGVGRLRASKTAESAAP